MRERSGSPEARKTSLEVYRDLKQNQELNRSNRKELEEHVQGGSRPFYGFPHMNFNEKAPKKQEGIDYFHQRMNFKWKIMSRSITRE